MWGQHTAKYMVRKCTVAYCRPAGLHERTSDNIAAARKFDKSLLEQFTPEDKEWYEQYRDVKMEENFQCSVPGYNDNAKAIAQVWGELDSAMRHFGNDMLSGDLWSTANRLCSQVHAPHDHVQSINDFIRQETQHRMLAIVDRDVARRASMDEKGYIALPQLGRVILEDGVEIGSNCTIDRGSLKDTEIGAQTRIDNLVQIAHNVRLGRGCIIVAQVGIAGSTVFGDYVAAGGQAGFADHLKIGSRARIAGQSGVMRDIKDGETVAGSPALPIIEWRKQNVYLTRLIHNSFGKDKEMSPKQS